MGDQHPKSKKTKIIETVLITTISAILVEGIWIFMLNQPTHWQHIKAALPEDLYWSFFVTWIAVMLVHGVWKEP